MKFNIIIIKFFIKNFLMKVHLEKFVNSNSYMAFNTNDNFFLDLHNIIFYFFHLIKLI